MKKILVLTLCLSMVLSIAGYGKKSEEKKPEENIKIEQSTNNSEVEKENFEKTGGTYEMTEHLSKKSKNTPTSIGSGMNW